MDVKGSTIPYVDAFSRIVFVKEMLENYNNVDDNIICL